MSSKDLEIIRRFCLSMSMSDMSEEINGLFRDVLEGVKHRKRVRKNEAKIEDEWLSQRVKLQNYGLDSSFAPSRRIALRHPSLNTAGRTSGIQERLCVHAKQHPRAPSETTLTGTAKEWSLLLKRRDQAVNLGVKVREREEQITSAMEKFAVGHRDLPVAMADIIQEMSRRRKECQRFEEECAARLKPQKERKERAAREEKIQEGLTEIRKREIVLEIDRQKNEAERKRLER